MRFHQAWTPCHQPPNKVDYLWSLKPATATFYLVAFIIQDYLPVDLLRITCDFRIQFSTVKRH